MNKKKVRIIAFVLLGILLIGLFFWSVRTGGLSVSTNRLLKGLFMEYDKKVATIYHLRFPRIFVAVLAGAGIAVSGVLLQAVLKNPLADPGIIGISGGAGFFAAIAGLLFPGLFVLTSLFSFVGGLLAFLIVYVIAFKEGLKPTNILLIGIAINGMFEGGLRLLSQVSGQGTSGIASIVEGSISLTTWRDVRILLIMVIPGIMLALLTAKQCDLLQLEEKTISSLGINVPLMRILISFLAIIIVCGCTAITGVIGFLGLIVPHMGRLIVGAEHKYLLPFSALLGSFIFLIADTFGRSIVYPREISPAILMTIVGGPVFIYLLRRKKR
ncbi:MAG TPA: iron ABC transporter permease [Candidatus Dorea intestinavium]|nr:iron ABC transporter permease [Candidatus Dorea intestinavium]